MTLSGHRHAIKALTAWSKFEHRQTTLPHSNALVMCCLVFMLMLANAALAQDTSRLADNYIRTDFTVENGLPDNVVNAIVQTANGLLWVGTESGLASFDGRDFTSIDLKTAGSPSPGAVRALLESSDGDLWVGTDVGVVVIPRSALDRFDPALLTFYRLSSGPSLAVEALLQARDGTVWAGTDDGLYRQDAGRFVEVIPAVSVSQINQALDGHLLLVTGQAFIEWDGHQIIRHPGLAASLGVHDDQIFGVFQDPSGTMWYCTNQGVMRRGDPRPPPLQPSQVEKTAAFRIYQDFEDNLWVASGIGIYRVDGEQLDTPAPNLHAALLLCQPRWRLVDRHQRQWPGSPQTSRGAYVSPRQTACQTTSPWRFCRGMMAGSGLAATADFLLLMESTSSSIARKTAFSTPASGLWQRMRKTTYGSEPTAVELFRFRDGHFMQYSAEQGLISKIVLQIVVAQDDSLWAATPDGLSHIQDGHIRNYTVADGLSSNRVLSVHQDRAGNTMGGNPGRCRSSCRRAVSPFPAEPTEGWPLLGKVC